MTEETFAVEFTCVEDDFQQLGRYWVRAQPAYRSLLPMIGMTVFLVLLLFSFATDLGLIGVALSVFGTLLAVSVTWWMVVQLPLRTARQDPKWHFESPIRIGASATDIHIDRPLSHSKISVRGLKSVGATDQYVFFHFAGRAVFFVPRRAFATDDEWNRFVAYAGQLKASKT